MAFVARRVCCRGAPQQLLRRVAAGSIAPRPIAPPPPFLNALRGFTAAASDAPATAAGDDPIVQTIVRHPISLLEPYLSDEEKAELAAVNAAGGALRAFAVVRLSGTQYKVTKDDLIVSNRIHGYDVGESFALDDVLLLGTQNETRVGRPTVPGAQVMLTVEEHTKDQKVVIFKKRRRKNYKRKTGFRRDVTLLRVSDIVEP